MKAKRAGTCANGIFVGNKTKFNCVTFDRRAEMLSGSGQDKELTLYNQINMSSSRDGVEGLTLRPLTCTLVPVGGRSLSV